MTNPTETTSSTWFSLASDSSRWAYILACAIQDRRESAAYWLNESNKPNLDYVHKKRYEQMHRDTMQIVREMRDMQENWHKYGFITEPQFRG